jgi:hypothetical protein
LVLFFFLCQVSEFLDFVVINNKVFAIVVTTLQSLFGVSGKDGLFITNESKVVVWVNLDAFDLSVW